MATLIHKYRVWCDTESAYVETWDETEPTDCPNNNAHSIDTTKTSVLEEASTSIVDVNNSPNVIPRKPTTGNRAYCFSHDFTKKTTWYYSSVVVTGESVGTGDGATAVFSLTNNNIIDLTHGYLTDEDYLDPPSGLTQWAPIVYLDGVVQTERVPFATSGGDYEIDYSTGDITFYTAPGNGVAITADYAYSPDTAGSSIIEFGPPAGKVWNIDRAEAQFSKDVILTDDIVWSVFVGGVEVDPTLRSTYKRVQNFHDYAFGSYPVIPAFGGADRGASQDTILLRWEYLIPIIVDNATGAKIRVWMTNDTPFTGERATVTLYAEETDG